MSERSRSDEIAAVWLWLLAMVEGAVPWLRAQVLAERGRWALWLPIGLGAGAALYFELPLEVPFWASVAVAAFAALVVAWRVGKSPIWIVSVAAAVLLVAAGFALGAGRTARVAAPMLVDDLGPVWVEGRVIRVENTDDGFRRITLSPTRIEDLNAATRPARIRVSVRQQGDEIVPGQSVSMLAMLLPPSGPPAPGAFDFARKAYFNRLGAVGYSLTAPGLENSDAPQSLRTRIQGAVARVRHTMATRVRAALPGSRGGVAAALITGDRSGVAEADIRALRGSGLAHLLAISGLHMALVGGLLFFSIRMALTLHEKWALTKPIKKWAAVAALAGAFCYLVLSGGSVSTQRAFIMIAIAFLAILTDRPVLSMRTVAVAALAIIVLAPESVTQVGFQMSFAAVVMLIALSEWLQPRLAAGLREGGRSWWQRGLTYFAGLSVTSMAVGLTIAPFAAYHFNRFSNYEVAANLVAMPVMAFWVMPWGIITVFLMPLGLEGLALQPMGWGIDLILGTAHGVSSWPGAEATAAAVAPWVLAAIALGGAWIAIWQRPWRWAGTVLIVAGLAAFPLARGPDVLIQAAGETLAVRGGDGALALLYPRRARYEQEIWLRRDGDRRELSDARGTFPCDALGCTVRLSNGWLLSYAAEPEALIDDCQLADVLVTPVPVRIHCPRPRIIIDYYALREGGAHSLSFTDEGIDVRRAEDTRRGRPWSHSDDQ